MLSLQNVDAINNYPIPRNVKEVHRFIGVTSYFRRFVPSFSLITKPLYDVLKKDRSFCFDPVELEAFEIKKNKLTSDSILAIYSPHAETELHCDVSASGFGAMLPYKQKDGLFQPISYFSHRTTPTESKYHSLELECLAAIYAIKRFHIYLSGKKFKIITDCDSFNLTLKKKDINPRISRMGHVFTKLRL